MKRLTAVLVAGAAIGLAQPETAARAAREWRQNHEREILTEFTRLLSLPNVARNLDDMRRNASLIEEMYAKRGIKLHRLEVEGAPPALFGELPVEGARESVVVYAHYDGQPVVPAQWANGKPFEPELRDAAGKLAPLAPPFDPEWRLHARSASDDKAPIIALLAALDGLKAKSIRPSLNLKFFFDGEEEAGSARLGAILARYKQRIGPGGWIFLDGPVHQTRRQQIAFGVRGHVGFEITVYGPRRELHSGHYGNWAPNPAMMLAQLIASMKDEDGRVRIAGFYDDVTPLNDAEKRAVAATPDIEAGLLRELWLGTTEVPGRRIDASLTLPALNVQGMLSSSVGSEARNVIPSTATASFGIRLVKGMDPAKTVDQVAGHIRKQGYHVTDREPDEAARRAHPKICYLRRMRDGTRAVRVPLDSAFALRVTAAVEAARGPVVKLPTMGGTLPIAPIEDAMGEPVVVVPIANHDNNQHSHNENIRLQNLWDGIETLAALMAMR
jgi:acetylornithine deacetylase/succinyl-diaminopimelate desuccinylase-like protein